MKTTATVLALVLLTLVSSPRAEVKLDGFLQGLYGARADIANPTATEYPASETRLQLRLEEYGDNAEVFGRMDFFYDAADSARYEWELREGYLKFRLGSRFDFKIGRQVLTWGTGDLIFINDVFAKDYRSFFVGRDDQYLKAPQTALRTEFYAGRYGLTLVVIPRFEPNRLPTGRKLSYFNPMVTPGGAIVGEGFFFDPPLPEARIDNSELALRLSRPVGNFNASLYVYRGFYKNPLGAEPLFGGSGMVIPVYPRLNLYGASIRGVIAGGVLWLEGGFLDSRRDPDGDDPLMPNSSATGLFGFERQIATNLTVNLQWQADFLFDHDKFASMQPPGLFVRDELRHLLTSRVTKLLLDENLTLSGFMFYSPSDEDAYLRASASYKYTDELTLAIGGNLFAGRHPNTEFGQFQKNDNAYLKVTYGF